MKNLLRRLIMVEWSGLLAAIVIGSAVLALLSPAFLTEFNIYVMLRSFCVGLLVGFAQMVTLGVGQMNISVGALGGLVAISAGGMMEVLGFPLIVAVLLALLIGALGGLINGLLTVRTGINGFIITLATASAFTGHQSRHHGVDPVLSSVAGAGRFWRGAGRGVSVLCSWRR